MDAVNSLDSLDWAALGVTFQMAAAMRQLRSTSQWMHATATTYCCCACTDYTDQGFLTLSPSINGELSIDLAK